MPEQKDTRRRPWVAGLLSLIGGPLGQLYAGRGVRFLTLAVLSLLLLPLTSAIAVSLPGDRYAFIGLLAVILSYPVFLIVDAFRIAQRDATTELKWFQRWWVYPLVLLAYLAAAESVSKLTRTYIAEAFFVPANSMSPTLIAGDRILVSRMANADSVKHGDVIAFESSERGNPLYLKRVLALEGDTISIVDEEVILNGERIADPHPYFGGNLPALPNVAEQLTQMEEVSVPKDYFFVLGDYRRKSVDSRFFGPISKTSYRGKAVRIYWSGSAVAKGTEDLTGLDENLGAWERTGMAIH